MGSSQLWNQNGKEYNKGMVELRNIEVYDFIESVIACRNAVSVEIPYYSKENFDEALIRANKLAKLGGGTGHSNFRKGIRVSFDIKYPNYFSPELQRYSFIDIVCSSSKMHKIMTMDFDKCCNKYVLSSTKGIMKEIIAEYNQNKSYELFMKVISNCPQGLELFMRISTNYEQLATIYRQRKSHKLKEDWGVFCDMIEKLPYSKELITGW